MTPRELVYFQERADTADPDACWPWRGQRTHLGYGRWRCNRQTYFAHRISYMHFVGPIPADKVLDHLCRNPPCVNPRHLEAVSQRENVLRSPISTFAIKARQTHCAKGHLFDEHNTRPHGKYGRRCRICARNRQNARYAMNRVEINARRRSKYAAI